MTKQLFEITGDVGRKFLRMTFTGLWTVETVEQLRIESRREVQRLATQGCAPRDLVILMDRRGQGPHSQDVVRALQVMSAENSGRAKRVALLIAGSLNKLQTDRIKQAGATRVFNSEEEATAWLFGPDQDAPSAKNCEAHAV